MLTISKTHVLKNIQREFLIEIDSVTEVFIAPGQNRTLVLRYMSQTVGYSTKINYANIGERTYNWFYHGN